MAISHWKSQPGYRRTAQAASAIPQEYWPEREVITNDDLRKEGKLTGVSDDAITLEFTTEKEKAETKTETIGFTDIKQTVAIGYILNLNKPRHRQGIKQGR